MRLGLPLNQNYWPIVALSSASRNGPRANLTNPAVNLVGDEVGFVSEWDYLIRVKPINDEGVIQATIQEEGGTEADFLTGFNQITIDDDVRPQDTIRFEIDLDELPRLNPETETIHVSLLTIESPFNLDPEETNLALDTIVGDRPNYEQLNLEDQERVLPQDPQQQSTVRRSRQLLADENVTTLEGIDVRQLEVLAANIVTFEMELVER